MQPELYWQSDSGNQRLAFVGFGRADSHDSERSHVDIREAYWAIDGDGWDLNAGINKVFWGVAESRHLVDVINQTDLVEDIDQEDKLGQPMVNLNLQRDFGRFEFFVLPYFRERTFAGRRWATSAAACRSTRSMRLFESSDDESNVDYAFALQPLLSATSISLPTCSMAPRVSHCWCRRKTVESLLPYYEQMTQAGVELQYTGDAWLWKLESIYRDANSDAFFAAVGGFEYTFYGVRDSDADVGLLVEYLYDDRSTDAAPTAFDNDVFVGTRLALNDASDTSVLAGFVVDADSQEMFFNVEAERRFNDNIVAELRIRAFANAEVNELLYAFENDDYVQLRLSWYY